MAVYLRPDVYIEEVVDNKKPITGVGTSITGFMGVARRGPIGQPVYLTSLSDFTRVFGDPLQGQALYYNVAGFFKNGGTGCYINRVGHYADVDAGTIVADAAELTLDGLGAPTAARLEGVADVTTVSGINSGETLVLDSTATGGPNTVTFTGTKTTLTPAAGDWGAGAPGDSFQYKIDGGLVKEVDCSVGTGAFASIGEWTAFLNANVEGVSVTDDGANQTFSTDSEGNNSSIEIVSVSGNAGLRLGLVAATATNAGSNVDDLDNITFAELQTLIAAATTDVAISQGGGGVLVLLEESTTGLASTITIDAGSTANVLTLLGLTAGVTQGAAAGAAVSLTVNAGFRGLQAPGVYGNDLSVSIEDDALHPSAGAGNDLANNALAGATQIILSSIVGVSEGSYLELDDGGGTTEYVTVSSSETLLVGGVVQHQVNLTAPLVNPFSAAASAVRSLEHKVTIFEGDEVLETWINLSMNPLVNNNLATALNDSEIGSQFITVTDAGLTYPDNVLQVAPQTDLAGGSDELAGFVPGDIVGSPTGKSGVYAFDVAQDLNLLCCSPSFGGITTIVANTTVQTALLEYCKERMDCFALLDCPDGSLSPTAVADYRNNTLGADSYWGALYYPFLEVPDPLGVGANPTVMVPPTGHVAGIFARVDSVPPPAGGVATAPAGIGDFGKVENCVGLETYVNDREQDTLNPIGVNCIRKFSRGGPTAPGIVVFGARTLSSVKQFRYIQVRRLMTFIEQSVRLGSRFAVFRNNDFRLWGQLTDLITGFLRGLHRNGQLQGKKAEEAYFVKIDETTTTASNVDDGVLIGEIGVSPQKPAEFIVFKFSQFQAGSSITE